MSLIIRTVYKIYWLRAISLHKVDNYYFHLQMGKQTFCLNDLSKVNWWWKCNFTLLSDSPVCYTTFPAHLMLPMQTADMKTSFHAPLLLCTSTYLVFKSTCSKSTPINIYYQNNSMRFQQRPWQSQQRDLHGDWKSIRQREE